MELCGPESGTMRHHHINDYINSIAFLKNIYNKREGGRNTHRDVNLCIILGTKVTICHSNRLLEKVNQRTSTNTSYMWANISQLCACCNRF